MEAFGPFLDGYCNVHMQIWESLRRPTMAALRAHETEKVKMVAPEDVCARGEYVRKVFLNAIGGLPETSSPLNPRTCGVLDRGPYTIEKVIFESQPRAYVTALLYVPKALEQPAASVLFVSGHHREAKGNPEYQRVCHDLAINGFVVLAQDPTGQGERVTHFDPDTGTMALEWGTTEHSYHGQQCILTGTSIARYFLFDALRGIDYLQSRPEVDRNRIGVTGNSGGGTQTSLVCMSGDARIKAAAPCTYVTSREDYYRTGQPQDAEQLQFGMTASGIDFDDFFMIFAPRPLLIGAVASDFFSPEGTALTYRRLRRAYRLFHAEENVSCVVTPGLHNYNAQLRQAVVNWFRKHLRDVAPDFATADDEAIAVLPDRELWCTSKGHVLSDFPDARTPFHLNLDHIPARSTADADALRERTIEVLGLRERFEAQTPFFPRTIRDGEQDGLRARSIFFLSEPGVMTAGCLLHAPGNPETVTLFLAPGGTAQLDSHIAAARERIDAGEALFVYDVRGTGAVKADPVNPYGDTFPLTFFNTDAWYSWSAYCLGASLLGMRVFDVLRAARYLRDEGGFRNVRLWASGLEPALSGYLAAALDADIVDTRVDDLIESFEAIARTPLYRRDFTPPMVVHGILERCDLPDLRALFGGRALETHVVPVSAT